MKKLIYSFLLISSFCFAESLDLQDISKPDFIAEEIENSADCLILEDENSIICKYLHTRNPEDKEILVQWIDPNGEISRERFMIMPAGHGSIYDFRYIEGREKGIWQFKVVEDEIETTTTFQIN